MREMKDSGVEWIGEIPQKWKMCRLKNYAYIMNGADYKDIQDDNGNYPVIGSGGEFDRATKYLYDGESVLLGRKGTIDKPRYINGTFWTVDTMYYTKIKEIGIAKYLYYLCTQIQFDYYQYGSAVPSMTQRDLNSVRFPLPEIVEQENIVHYLDTKCSKIDEIIEKQQAIIEKLKEYKFSIITEAVTKGINPDVEMKDSTIDMCEQIPVHWGISQNRYLFSLRDEKNYKPLEEVRLLSLYTDLGVFPHGEQEERGNKAVKAEGYKVVYENDIVVNIILAWMGAIGRSAYDGVTSPAYDIYKPNEDVCSRYYHYLYRTKPFSAECYKYGRGIMAMRWRTYSSEFKSIKVPVPPYIEQCQIADYLDSKCDMLDKTIADRNKAIDKLQEYKKSLIYEVVTGKKEV
mgnify:FL=1